MSVDNGIDEAPIASFWEVGQYKQTVARLENGAKLCDDLMMFIKERAAIEDAYQKQLKAWSAKFQKIIEKNSSYNTLQSAWSGMLNEAERLAQLHFKAKESLSSGPYEKVKQWKKDNYHTSLFGGLKEGKTCSDEFTKAQKPWAKALKKSIDAKKGYYNGCKEELSARTQVSNTKSDPTATTEKVVKLKELVEKRGADRIKLRQKYEDSVKEVSNCKAKYMEDMERVFKKCQDFEEKKLKFFKEIFFIIHMYLDIPSEQELSRIYVDLRQTINLASAREDLNWWSATFGPDMPIKMKWPEFEEYSFLELLVHKTSSKVVGSETNRRKSHSARKHSQKGNNITRNKLTKKLRKELSTAFKRWTSSDEELPSSSKPEKPSRPGKPSKPEKPPRVVKSRTHKPVKSKLDASRNSTHHEQTIYAATTPDDIYTSESYATEEVDASIIYDYVNLKWTSVENAAPPPALINDREPTLIDIHDPASVDCHDPPLIDSFHHSPIGSHDHTVTDAQYELDYSDGVPVLAVYDYTGEEHDEITFVAGDTVHKLSDEDAQGWCRGRLQDGTVGFFPSKYVASFPQI